jgi:site-specific DNA-methyltransferase (adenine-specific)
MTDRITQMDFFKIYNESCMETMSRMEDESVNCIVTSPPYFAKRIYGNGESEIGLETKPTDYIDSLVSVFSEAHRVLKKDGNLFVNIGDTYNGYKHGNDNKKWAKANTKDFVKHKWEGAKNRDLIGIPWMLAFALRDRVGYYLRNDIIWNKPNAVPEPVTNRFVKSHEHVFFFTKTTDNYFDYDSVGEVASGGGKRRKRDVWSINVEHSDIEHNAMFPESLVLPCIMSGCPNDGVVYDPFTGSGTTGVVALKTGRRFVGSEINHDFFEMANRRISMASPKDLKKLF